MRPFPGVFSRGTSCRKACVALCPLSRTVNSASLLSLQVTSGSEAVLRLLPQIWGQIQVGLYRVAAVR